MVIDYEEFRLTSEERAEMREMVREYEREAAAEYAYDGYVPLDEDEMDGFHIVYDNE